MLVDVHGQRAAELARARAVAAAQEQLAARLARLQVSSEH
jgi:hypothetical protein